MSAHLVPLDTHWVNWGHELPVTATDYEIGLLLHNGWAHFFDAIFWDGGFYGGGIAGGFAEVADFIVPPGGIPEAARPQSPRSITLRAYDLDSDPLYATTEWPTTVYPDGSWRIHARTPDSPEGIYPARPYVIRGETHITFYLPQAFYPISDAAAADPDPSIFVPMPGVQPGWTGTDVRWGTHSGVAHMAGAVVNEGAPYPAERPIDPPSVPPELALRPPFRSYGYWENTVYDADGRGWTAYNSSGELVLITAAQERQAYLGTIDESQRYTEGWKEGVIVPVPPSTSLSLPYSQTGQSSPSGAASLAIDELNRQRVSFQWSDALPQDSGFTGGTASIDHDGRHTGVVWNYIDGDNFYFVKIEFWRNDPPTHTLSKQAFYKVQGGLVTTLTEHWNFFARNFGYARKPDGSYELSYRVLTNPTTVVPVPNPLPWSPVFGYFTGPQDQITWLDVRGGVDFSAYPEPGNAALDLSTVWWPTEFTGAVDLGPLERGARSRRRVVGRSVAP